MKHHRLDNCFARRDDARRWRARAADSRDEVLRQAASDHRGACAPRATRRCARSRSSSAAPRSTSCGSSAAEFREARAALRADADRGARARGRQRRALSRSAGFRAAVASRPCPACVCERITRPIDSVGLYVPAGSAPLPSTAIMLGRARADRRLPGARDRAARPGPTASCTPRCSCAARAVRRRHACYKMGGAQAIAALAFGTRDRSQGRQDLRPGSAWVTAAKQIVAARSGRRRHRPAGRAVRGAGDRRRLRAMRSSSPRTCSRRPSTTPIAQVVLVTTSTRAGAGRRWRSSTRRLRALEPARHRRAVDGAQPLHPRADLDDARSRCRTNTRPST